MSQRIECWSRSCEWAGCPEFAQSYEWPGRLGRQANAPPDALPGGANPRRAVIASGSSPVTCAPSIGPMRGSPVGKQYPCRFAGRKNPGGLAGACASLASELCVLSLQVPLLFHLVHLQLEQAAVADELRELRLPSVVV